MRSVNIIGKHDYLTAQMLALLYFTSGKAFFDDTIVSAFHTTDLIIKQSSLHNFPPEMFAGREQSPQKQHSVCYENNSPCSNWGKTAISSNIQNVQITTK